MPRQTDFALLSLWIVAFAAWPQLDLEVSGLVWNASGGFVLRNDPWLCGICSLVSRLMLVVAAALALAMLLGSLYRRSRFGAWRRGAAFLLFALLIGPGLIVNDGFKAHWGRARPREVQPFGGPMAFTPALLPGHSPDRNGSFVSGHAAAGFSLMAPALLMSSRRNRRRWVLLGAGAGLLIGLGRILQGAHFLSDVLFAGSVVWLSLRASHHVFDRWLWPGKPAPLPPPLPLPLPLPIAGQPIQPLETGT